MIVEATCIQGYWLNTSNKIMFNNQKYFQQEWKETNKIRYIFNTGNFVEYFFLVSLSVIILEFFVSIVWRTDLKWSYVPRE